MGFLTHLTLEPILKDSIIPEKETYPYLTFYKKEPHKSFLFIGKREVGNFYFGAYGDVENLYQQYNDTLLNEKSLNLENIYWFLLLRKFLRKDKKHDWEEFYKFIKRCQVHEDGVLGFKFSPNSKSKPDLWSTYFALASLKLLGLLKEYLASKGLNVRYLHSEIDTLERIDILKDLRKGEFDCLVGVNLLREGLDLPEVTLVAILDADALMPKWAWALPP